MSFEQVEDGSGESQDVHDADAAAFRIPVPKYTVVVLACIAAVFAAQLWADAYRPESISDLLFHELRNSIFAAGFVKPAFISGAYWLILTGAFLHGFFVHAAMNAYALYSFGKLFELLTNRAHLPIVFLLSAVGGGLLSVVFLPEGISVGASGGIVGLLGYLVVYAFRRRKFVSAEFRKSLLVNIGFILLFGFVLYGIVDNWGHIGGLLVGALYAVLQIPSDEYKNPQDAGPFAEIAGIAALGICIAVSVFSIYLVLYA